MLMGFRRDFSRGWQRRYFAYPFSDCKRCNGNGHLQNAFPFNTVKKVPHESTPMRCIRVCEKFVLFSSFTAFAELGYHPISLLL